MRVKLCFIVLILFCPAAQLRAQDPDLERYIESEEEQRDPTVFLDYLESLRRNPMDLNRASATQLQTLPWISPTLAAAIIAAREEGGFFSAGEDLLDVAGMDAERLALMQPFVRVSLQRPEPRLSVQFRHRLQRDIQKARGYQEGIYAGGPEKIYNRLTGEMGENMRFCLLGEKDAGEERLDDLLTGFGGYRTSGGRLELLIGDMVMECGQGLVFWSPYQIQKGYDAVAPGKQRPRGLKPFCSVSENRAFRGAGLSVELGRWQVNVLASRTGRDATIRSDSVSALLESGYHRTTSEIDRRDALDERLGGVVANWDPHPAARFGLGLQRTDYDHPFSGGDDFYGFTGKSNTVAGAHYDLAYRDINLFGEAARSSSGGWAMISGCWFERGDVDLVFSWRSFQKDFHNFHGSAFGERSK